MEKEFDVSGPSGSISLKMSLSDLSMLKDIVKTYKYRFVDGDNPSCYDQLVDKILAIEV
jgi:hypothetical protein